MKTTGVLILPNSIQGLRKRAEIRLKATCRGNEDRLAQQLLWAANELERLYILEDNLNIDKDGDGFICREALKLFKEKYETL